MQINHSILFLNKISNQKLNLDSLDSYLCRSSVWKINSSLSSPFHYKLYKSLKSFLLALSTHVSNPSSPAKLTCQKMWLQTCICNLTSMYPVHVWWMCDYQSTISRSLTFLCVYLVNNLGSNSNTDKYSVHGGTFVYPAHKQTTTYQCCQL